MHSLQHKCLYKKCEKYVNNKKPASVRAKTVRKALSINCGRKKIVNFMLSRLIRTQIQIYIRGIVRYSIRTNAKPPSDDIANKEWVLWILFMNIVNDVILCGCVTTVKTMQRWDDGVVKQHHHHRAHHLRSTCMLYINVDDNWQQLYASDATEQPC